MIWRNQCPRNCAGVLWLLFAVAGGVMGAPNIVIFFSDDHTQQVISAYQDLPGAKPQDLVFKDWAAAQTPNIDRLATQGAIFTNSFVSNSICQPSRANLLTGWHSHVNGQFSNNGGFDGSQQNFPKLLQAAGYDTSHFGKWHLGTEPTGFDHYERLIGQGAYYSPKLRVTQAGGGTTDITYSGEYVSEVITTRALAWLQDRIDNSATDPFLLIVNHKGTHRNWRPGPVETDPAVFRQTEWDFSVAPNPDTDPGSPQNWTPAAAPRPGNYLDYLNLYPTRHEGARQQTMEVANDTSLDNDLKLTGSFGGTGYDELRTWWSADSAGLTQQQKDDHRYNRYVKDYALTGKSVDRGVGGVLDFLETNNLDRNTIIIYASDQGFYLGEHGWFDKRWMYEESLRTPLLMQWKDAAGASVITPGSQVSEMVQVIDYGPTVLDAAGVSGFQPMHGESFLGFVTAAAGDEPASWRDKLYYHYYEGLGKAHNVGRHYGVRDDRHKLIYHYDFDQWELFDLQTDAFEMNNLLYDAGSGGIDDPTDGIEGTQEFQDLVSGLMVDLRALRTQYGDTTGPDFVIPGVGPVPPLDPDLLVDLVPADAGYDGSGIGSGGQTMTQPNLSQGLTLHIKFTPTANDLAGTVLLMEIGGNSNGSGLYLVDGVPTFVQKQNSSDPVFPDSLNDTALNEIAVQSSLGMVAAGTEYRLTAIYDPPVTGSVGDLELAIQPAGGNVTIDAFGITGASSGGNWSGNETLSVGVRDGNNNSAGGLTTTAGPFHSGSLASLDGSVGRGLYWNAVGAIVSQMAVTDVGFDGGAFDVGIRNLVTGASYRLFRDTALPIGGYKVEVDSVTAGAGPAVLSDDGVPDPLPAERAFYHVVEER